MTEVSWDVLDEELAYTCDGFDVITEDVRLPDGTRTDFDFVSLPESVVLLPFTEAGAVVVIDEWREAVGRRNRGLPAGNLKDDEEPLAAARRELREETGYEAGEFEHLTSVEPANGFADAVYHYYVARNCKAGATQDLDEDEDIRVGTAALETLVEDARSGELRDGRSVLAILFYALFEDGADLSSG